MRIYLGLGSNIGVRVQTIHQALEMMPDKGISVVGVSRMYETEPWGVGNQPRFINAVCEAVTELPPKELLNALKAIEQALGREPGVRWGPRPIDIDILLYDDQQIRTNELTIPHPGMLWRASVLVPLVELAPGLKHPQTGRTMQAHLHDLGPVPDVAPYPPGLPVRKE
ncbi:MAG: 2-amino-4-hydroxy-6-hydroxymethyldihydropteridine diphosphokinase [Chloroflexi bacterium]|nr:2-amino-4-hydroxy-6-hydroxymethyldihydropteridine diphosphokinase [Chloroflexota bacterium]